MRLQFSLLFFVDMRVKGSRYVLTHNHLINMQFTKDRVSVSLVIKSEPGSRLSDV
jgi:hypothetical protein